MSTSGGRPGGLGKDSPHRLHSYSGVSRRCGAQPSEDSCAQGPSLSFRGPAREPSVLQSPAWFPDRGGLSQPPPCPGHAALSPVQQCGHVSAAGLEAAGTRWAQACGGGCSVHGHKHPRGWSFVLGEPTAGHFPFPQSLPEPSEQPEQLVVNLSKAGGAKRGWALLLLLPCFPAHPAQWGLAKGWPWCGRWVHVSGSEMQEGVHGLAG